MKNEKEIYDFLTNFENCDLKVNLMKYAIFVKKFKHEPQKLTKNPDERKLAYWIDYQNELVSKDLLTENQLSIWEARNVITKKRVKAWDELLSDLDKKAPVHYIAQRIELFSEYYKDFLKQENHWPIEASKNPVEAWLAIWATYCMNLRDCGMLSSKQRNLLNSCGGAFDPRLAKWMENFQESKNFRKATGMLPMSNSNNISEAKLAVWERNQTKAFNAGQLCEEQIILLESINFEFGRHKAVWNDNFDELVEYIKVHHEIPRSYKNDKTNNPERFKLADWLKRQQEAYMAGKLPIERIEKLNSVGISLNKKSPQHQWIDLLHLDLEFRKKTNRAPKWIHGEDFDGTPEQKEEKTLAVWEATQRRRIRDGTIKPERLELLKIHGIALDSGIKTWDQSFAELQQFVKQNKRYPIRCAKTMEGLTPKQQEELKLARWLYRQIKNLQENNLEEYQQVLIKSLNFKKIKTKNQKWENSFEKVSYFVKHHSRMPRELKNPKDKEQKLESECAKWVSYEKDMLRTGRLTKERFLRLKKANIILSNKQREEEAIKKFFVELNNNKELSK